MNTDILARVAKGELTVDEAAKLLGNGNHQVKPSVALNRAENLCLRHPRFKAYSKAKKKTYNATINLTGGVEVATALFGTVEDHADADQFIEAIREYLSKCQDKKFRKAEVAKAVAKAAARESAKKSD